MNKVSTFTKVLCGAIVWTVVFLGIAAYSSEKAMKNDPELISKIQSNLGDKFKGNIQFNISGVNGEETTDNWNLSMPKANIEIKSVAGDFKIKKTNGTMVVIHATGKLDKSKAEHLLVINQSGENLEITEPNQGGAVSHLSVEIQIPEKFQNELDVKVVSGDIDVKGLGLSGLSVKTVSGDISVDDVKVKKVDFKTVSGNISIDNDEAADLDVVTISGEVKLNLPADLRDTKFNLNSLSGDIQNTHSSSSKGRFSVNVKTTSGDIHIQ